MAFDKLFSPIQIRGLELKNRVVMSGMGTHMTGMDSSEVNQKLMDYHVARARGGVAMNTTEVCSVDAPSSPKGFMSISEDKYIPGLKKLCDAVHDAGGKMCVQLWQGSLAVGMDPTAEMLVVSDMPVSPEYTIPGISIERLKSVVQAYGKAAARAVEAGFDAIEFHCAHNYLPHSFLSGGINHRTDEYGGSFENRVKFPLECIESIRRNIPEDMPLFMRVDCHDDFLENGLTTDDIIAFCKLAKEKGVDVLNISRGNILTAAVMYETPPVDLPNGFNVEKAARIRKETGMLTMPAGRINTPGYAEQILNEDKADLVVMARAQLADPEFCNKAKAGKLSAIKYCIGCDQGCYDYFVDMTKEHISCLRNPAVGHEAEYELKKTDSPKKVLIAGGGMAGLEAADVLVRRGHIPVIYEQDDHLGGQMLLAGVAPRKADTAMAAEMAAKNAVDSGVEIHLNTKVDAKILKECKPDEVIAAIGAEPFIPAIDGMTESYVTDAHTVLKNKIRLDGKIVVIGGGLVGLEAAEYLKTPENQVTVVEMLEEVGKDLGEMRKIAVNMAIAEAGIQTMVKTKCLSIADHKVKVEEDGVEKQLAADTVVIAVGAKSRSTQEILEACEQMGIPCHVVGDAVKARRALNAIHEAFTVARKI